MLRTPRHHSKIASLRTARGSYLLEMLVAIGISGFLAVIMSMSLASTMRTSTSTDNQVVAATLAQGVVEHLRNQSWSTWPPVPYSSQLPVYSNDGVPANTYFPTPLLMDLSADTWSQGSTTNRFNGTVFLTLAQGPTNTTDLATVTVKWNEVNAQKQYVLNSVVSQYGFHM
jgi:type II secretory pathway pseudopilin PulG